MKKILNDIDVYSVFQTISLFNEIADSAGMKELAAQSVIVSEKKNVTLIREGEVGSKTFIMLHGTAEVRMKNISGGDSLVAVLQADFSKHIHPIVGELSLISEKSRSATICTTSIVTLLVIENKTFFSIADTFPHIGMHVYKLLCLQIQTRLERANKNVMALFEAYVDEMSEPVKEHVSPTSYFT